MSQGFREFMETPTASLYINADGTYDVVEKAQVVVSTGGGGGKPETTFDVNPSTTDQTVTPPTGSVFSSGIVRAIQTETKTATTNGTVTPTSGKYLTSVTVAIPAYTDLS